LASPGCGPRGWRFHGKFGGQFRAAVAHVNDLALAALLFDRRDPVELLDFLGAAKTIHWSQKATKPRRHGRPWTGKVRKGPRCPTAGRARSGDQLLTD